jgi:hypothetical protein
MIPQNIQEFAQTCSTSDLIRLHLLIKERYETLKKETPNFPALVWTVLNPQKARENNLKQHLKLQASKANKQNS